MMKLPERLEKKLGNDRLMLAAVNGAIAQFEPWIKDNKLPFFPNYTDHGIEHIEQVMATASSLIHDDAWAVLTSKDSAMLVLSCLLHDCAMHLSEDGFIALIGEDSGKHGIEGLDSVPWRQLWEDFLFSAKRFDDRTLQDIFGDTTPIRVPPLENPLNMNLRDRLLIGEFLRRHHARLAHEIAVFGLPTPSGRASLLPQLEDELADIAGLIARSHGMPLRTVVPYMKEHDYDTHDYQGIHAIFLMALLRVADYLQIQSERAPQQILKFKNIRSPLSLREFQVHGAVKGIHNSHEDPEAIMIHANPQDVKTFLRLKEWLSGIQSELDLSWAVIGETYAPARLTQLGLTIRRVRSNLDDEKTFASRVPYVPKRVEFDVARAEILKLLVRPLYGSSPEIGIRELMQNSLDAVRELWDLQIQRPELKAIPLLDQESDVEIWVNEPDENNVAWLTISDKGIGMTEDIVTNYFLKVGASFRQSDAWAKQHEDQEATVKSRVLRAGRFGIGALAAYLLGNEIEVSTRHISSDEGLTFKTKLDSEAIEIIRVNSLKVGTTIRVPLDDDVYDYLIDGYFGQHSWDWYCFEKPSVLRVVGAKREVREQSIIIPSLKGNGADGWHKISGDETMKVYITYKSRGVIACNGIKIHKNANIYDMGRNLSHLVIANPSISIYDADGRLQLDLRRSSIRNDKNLSDMYEKARREYFIAHVLKFSPKKISEMTSYKPMIIDVSSSSHEIRVWPFAYSSSGISLLDAYSIIKAGVDSIVFCGASYGIDKLNMKKGDKRVAVLRTPEKRQGEAFLRDFAKTMIGIERDEVFKNIADLCKGGIRIIVKSNEAEGLISYIADRIVAKKSPWKSVRENRLGEEWSSLIVGNPPPTKISIDWLDSIPSSDVPIAVGEWFLEDEQPEITPTDLALAWKDIIQDPIIPYDLKERRNKLSHAYEILSPYLENMTEEER